MTEMNNDIQTEQDKMQKDIQQLSSKYDFLSQEVQQLEKSKASLGEDFKQIHGKFENINKSISEIISKIDKISGEYVFENEEVPKDKGRSFSMKKIFLNPFRRLAVGTLSAVYAVADKTMEKSSNMKENFEDIVAEAQYAHKKKKMDPVANQ